MRRAGERGLSNSVQVAILLPLTLGIFLGLLQWSLNAWATATALASAQQAATVASAIGSSAEAGREAAADVHSNGSLSEVEVAVTRGARETTATVSGRPPTVLWPSVVTRTAVVATERLTAP